MKDKDLVAFEDKDHTYIKWFEFSDKTKHQLVMSENKVYLDGTNIEQLQARVQELEGKQIKGRCKDCKKTASNKPCPLSKLGYKPLAYCSEFEPKEGK
jgi:uncharacterized protein YhbP (UPF0306 family)